MECLTIASCVSSSLSSKTTNFGSFRFTPKAVQKHSPLAALQSAFHLFSSYAPKRNVHSFLPHLVASMEEVEQTYIMIKPDGVQRGLVGEIISRFERKGFKLTGLKLFQCPKELAEEHYKDLQSKPFFPKLIDYITSGPVVCMAWEGVGVVASARKLIGATNPLNAEPGTIRGDLAVQTGRNVVHGSDSPDNGKREIALWFKEGELSAWAPVQEPWLVE
ncbi:nucleoside diphosphate kinase 2, chloroplastic isoform X1 [Lycium ferocissimum]|uniref:nucleoside diphosphate kinase 2, chloroplastic isoform X1 n=1 Tax=Lycium ferocissimum TaxID=112874 RepID=UPI00281660A3|nr:nucleoside diphosphate kinase 2, chloroplastic isoform X1 [Lycium ferocissimum]